MLCGSIDFRFEPLFLRRKFCLRQNEIATEARKHRRGKRNCIFLCFSASVANKKFPKGINYKNQCSSTSWLMNFLRLIKAESYKRGTVLSVLFNIISKGILFLLTIIIARYFGSNIKTDIYFFVYSTMVLFSSFISNIDTSVIIPESMRLRENEGNDKATAFLNYFLLIYFIIGIGFTGLMYFCGQSLFGLISRFSDSDMVAYRNYFWLGSFFFIFMVLTNFINAILTSLKFFTMPMLISGINSIVVIAAIFLFKENYDALSIFIGGLIAYAINMIILIFVLKKIARWNRKISSSAIKNKIWINVFYAEMGQLINVCCSMFPLYLLSGFGSGILSVMNYGKNVADIPNTMFTSQFANVSGIKLNEQIARKDYTAMNNFFLRTSKFLVFVLVPVGFFLFVFARPVIEIIYLRGGFDMTAAAGAATFLQLFVVTVFSIAINAMVTRIFIARQALKQALIYQLIMSVILILLIWGFVACYGPYGYGYAVIVVNIMNIAGMFFICRIIAPELKYVTLVKYTGVIILINGIIGTAVYFISAWWQIAVIFKMITLFACWLFILLLLNKILHLNFKLVSIFKKVQ
jgi:putative peptidoglycan lipid II flippase